MQTSVEEMFSNQASEIVYVKDECMEGIWTQEVITKDETADVEMKHQHITETPVFLGSRTFLYYLGIVCISSCLRLNDIYFALICGYNI